MFKLVVSPGQRRVLVVAALLIAIAVFPAIALATSQANVTATPSDPPAPTLLASDVSFVGLSGLSEVFGEGSESLSVPVSSVITRSTAISIAEDYFGRYGHPERTYSGTLARPGGGSVQVWVVTFSGGRMPGAAPTGYGSAVKQLDMTVVILDASTGDVIETYGRGR